MKILKIIEKKPFVIGLFIFLLAFLLRLIAALKLAWRPDEIMYVDWVGKWFSEHFFSYFFQFFHQTYPPRSPYFGNPPLAMWILTLGVFLAQKFHFSILLGARLINVIIGSLTAVFLFYFGKKWFYFDKKCPNFFVGIFLALSFTLLTFAITNNGTAYLETLLVFLIVASLEFTFRYLKNRKPKDLYILGIILGLGFLTKFTILPLVFGLMIAIPVLSPRQRRFWRSYLILMAIIFFVPVILWSGLRDPQHFLGLYRVYHYQLYNPYLMEFSLPVFRYYYLMLIGILPPVIVLGILIKTIVLIRDLIQVGSSKYRQYAKEIIVVGLIIFFLVYMSIFASYGGSHYLMPILPPLLILAALGWEIAIRNFPRFGQVLAVIVIVIGLILPLFSFKPQYWGLYSSLLVGGTNRAFKLYAVGTGSEGIPQLAKFFENSTPKDSRIAVMVYDWTLPKYLSERSVTSLFPNDGLAGAMAKAGEFAVIPRTFLEEIPGKTALDFSKKTPIYTLNEKGIVLAKVYQIDTTVSRGESFNLGSSEDWQIKRRNNTPEFKIEDNQLKINYQFKEEFGDLEDEDSRILLISKTNFSPGEDKGIYLEAYGDGNQKTLSLIFSGEDKSFLTYETIFDWRGLKKLYIPFEQFQYFPSDPARNKPNFKQKYSLSLGILSKKAIQGEINIQNISLATLPEQQ